jgi:hypothetical protein
MATVLLFAFYAIFMCGDSQNVLLVTANVVPSSPIRVTLMMEALRFSETSVITRATRRNVLEDGILERAYVPLHMGMFSQCSVYHTSTHHSSGSRSAAIWDVTPFSPVNFFLHVTCVPPSWTLEVETVHRSKTSTSFQQTTRCHDSS